MEQKRNFPFLQECMQCDEYGAPLTQRQRLSACKRAGLLKQPLFSRNLTFILVSSTFFTFHSQFSFVYSAGYWGVTYNY